MSLFAGIDIRARFCAEKLKELMVLVEGVSEAESDAFTGPGDSAGEAGSVKKIESAVHGRMEALVKILSHLTDMRMPKWTTTEGVLRIAVKLYRHLKTATKLLMGAKVLPPVSFRRLVKSSNRDVTDHVYRLLQDLNSSEDTSEATRGAAKQELKLIPNLVFALEDAEKELTKYGKQCKVSPTSHCSRRCGRY